VRKYLKGLEKRLRRRRVREISEIPNKFSVFRVIGRLEENLSREISGDGKR
jgi:hypothetical protein